MLPQSSQNKRMSVNLAYPRNMNRYRTISVSLWDETIKCYGVEVTPRKAEKYFFFFISILNDPHIHYVLFLVSAEVLSLLMALNSKKKKKCY